MAHPERQGRYPEIPKTTPTTTLIASLAFRVLERSGINTGTVMCDDLEEYSDENIVKTLTSKISREQDLQILKESNDIIVATLTQLSESEQLIPATDASLLGLTSNAIMNRQVNLILMMQQSSALY